MIPKYNYKLIIAYDGTAYSGWQVQPNATSVQALIQDAIKTITRREVTLIGSGRTDAGVHALGQVAHFFCDLSLDLFRVIASINGLLPKDIRVLSIEEMPLTFHAQHNAIRKTYRYHLNLESFQNPFRRSYSWHVHGAINLDVLKEASQMFIGTHDFTSFANESYKGSAAKDPVRNLQHVNIMPEEGGVYLELTANGFLYKMVRNIVGTLVEIAAGKLPVKVIPEMFAAKDRRVAGQAAPPHGLFLVQVDYPESGLS